MDKSIYKGGIEALLSKSHPGRPMQMNFKEETELLNGFETKAAARQVVEVSNIKAAYQGKVGHKIGTAQIYYVFKRHEWRKVKP